MTTETPLSAFAIERDGNFVYIRIGTVVATLSEWAARRIGDDILRAAGVDMEWAAMTRKKWR